MKKLSLIFLLIPLLLFTGCSYPLQLEQEQPKEDPSAAYLERIAELEATLQKEREEKYISDKEFEARINELQELLDRLPTQGNNAQTGDTSAVFHYELRDGKAVITGFEGASTLINVPATLDGYPVIAIGERAFEGKQITAIALPEGIESVEWFAFYDCSSLRDVTLPRSITSIGYAVFDGCPDVTLICAQNSYAAEYAKSYGLALVTN